MKNVRIEEILRDTHDELACEDGLHRKGGNYMNTKLHGKAIVVIIIILILGLFKLVSYRANITKLFRIVHENQRQIRRCDCGNVDS